jgi:hypothetical protein
VQEVFAGCCLVVDATWWSALHPSGDYAAHPVAPEHCLASADAADEAAAACIDDWVDQQLGLPRHLSMQRRTTPQIRGRRRSWPRARLPRPSATGLSTVRIQPLWRGGPDRARASGQVSVLRVPGSFGTTWHSYEPRSP